MGPTWDPPGSCRPQMGPMLAPRTLLSGICFLEKLQHIILWNYPVIYRDSLDPLHSRPKRTPTHALTQVWKWPPFRGSWTRKTPLFQPKSPILNSNKTRFLRAKCNFLKLYKRKYPFCESGNNRIKFKTYFCTPYFSLWKEAKHAKCLPSSKISRIYAWKITHLLDFTNSCLPWKKCHIFRENCYKHHQAWM